jgi:hypothetical protein
LSQPVQECADASLPDWIVLGVRHKHPNVPLGLLRARNKRPTDRQAAEKRDKPAPAHVSPQSKDHANAAPD